MSNLSDVHIHQVMINYVGIEYIHLNTVHFSGLRRRHTASEEKGGKEVLQKGVIFSLFLQPLFCFIDPLMPTIRSMYKYNVHI